MNLFFLTVFGLYFVLMLGLIIGWQESLARKTSQDITTRLRNRITLIIPFRNEEPFIASLLHDVIHQQFDAGRLEVIFINDHSTDNSFEMLKKGIGGPFPIRVYSLPEGLTGKKQALAYAIDRASGEIIVTTDADCRMPGNWLTSMITQFVDSKVKMVFGGVRIQQDERFFSRVQALEFCSLIGTGAATTSLRFPTMCNGANLAFDKATFHLVKGYEGNFDIPSGDDEFLMRKIDLQFPGSIYFLPDSNAVVTTQPMQSRRDFVQQRLRWAGKWKYNSSPVAQLLALFVLLFQGSYLAIWLAPVIELIDWRFALFLVVVKMIFEFVFLFQVGSFTKVKLDFFPFLVLQFLYPVYVIYIGLTSPFSRYEWKTRTHSVGSNRHN